jgi:transposase
MHDKLFESALGISAPWSVKSVEFDAAAKRLTVLIDFTAGTRFAVPGHEGVHPVHDTVAKDYRHLNFFQHECHLRVRTPRVKLPDGSVRQVEPEFAGRLSGFALLFEALILMFAQQMPFAAVARIAGESAYRVAELCKRYVELALEQADFSDVKALAIDETRVPGATTTSPWRPMPCSAACSSSPRVATPARSASSRPTSMSTAVRPSRSTA